MTKFQSFWFGDSLPLYQRLAMKSFVDHGHAYILYAYKAFDVPAGVVLRDANEIMPESRVFFYGERAGVGRGSVAAFANLFRWHLLWQMGDWWVDTDVVCLTDAVPAGEIFMGHEINDVVNNAILKFPKRHGLVKELCELAEKAGTDFTWGTNGFELLTKLVRERGFIDLVTPQALAFPVQSVDALKLLLPAYRDEFREAIRDRPFLHMCNEIMRRAVIFPWMAPPPGCLLAELFERHDVDLGKAPVYTVDQIQRLHDNYYAAATWSHAIAENAKVARLEARLRGAQARAETLAEEVAQLRDRVFALQTSNSWRLTAPLRRMVTVLRRYGY